MANIRELEIKLGQTIEDTINQRLGYREYSVRLPNGLYLEPRPGVVNVSAKRFSEAQIALFIDKMGGSGIPSAIFEVMVSRAIPSDLVEEGGIWELKRDDQFEPTECVMLQIIYEDSRYKITLGVLKTSVWE